MVASFSDNPIAFLNGIQSSANPPSHLLLGSLAGSVASAVKDMMMNNAASDGAAANNPSSDLAFAYLRAAAAQLVVLEMAAPTTNAAAAGQEVQMTKNVYEVVEAVGHAVTFCTPRCRIAQSGILPVLAGVLERQQQQQASTTTPPLAVHLTYMSHVHVEFLQACIFAGQYGYAKRIVSSTWPLPNPNVTVRQVLRYYYLRGTMHIGNDDLALAIRSFWTCLVVPADVTSAICLAAWKKLILCQAILMVSDVSNASSSSSSTTRPTTGFVGPAFSVPKAMPSCIHRYLSSACEEQQQQQQQHERGSPEDLVEQAMNVVDDMEAEETAAAAPARGGGGGGRGGGCRLPAYYGVKAYADLIRAYTLVDGTQFAELLTQHSNSLFVADGNLGLVKQLQMQFVKRQVYAACRMYSVLSLQLLADTIGISIEKLQLVLLELASEGWAIDIPTNATGMVKFPKHSQDLQASAAQAPLELMQVTQMVQELDVSVATTPRYCAMTKKSGAQPRGVEEL